MSIIAYIILLAVMGGIIGALARLALPGRDPMTVFQTIGIGVLGSLIAGIVVRLATGGRYGAGFFLSFVVTVGLVYAVRRMRGGDLGQPAGPGGVGGRGGVGRRL